MAAGAAAVRWYKITLPSGPWPGRLAWALAAVYLAVFLPWALGRFYSLAYAGYDLGEYASLAYNTAHGHIAAHTFRGYVSRFDHCAPLLFTLAPFAYVLREPAYLIIIIVVATAASVALVYQTAVARGAQRWAAFALAAAYALTPALHGATLYENPLRAMAAPLVLAAFLFFFRRRFAGGVIFTALAATASEKVAVYAVVVTAVGAIINRRCFWGTVATAALALYAGPVCLNIYPKWGWHLPTVTNALVYLDAVKERGAAGLLATRGPIPLSNRLWYLAGIFGPAAPST